MKRILFTLMTIISLVVNLCLPQIILANDSTVTINIVHTNDIHGRSTYSENTVGFEKLSAFIKEIQGDIVVDAGDYYHGQAFATLEKGETMAELMKAVGYDAITPGNHDWNYGKEKLRELGKASGTKILAGNVSENGKDFFDNDGTVIKNINGVKIGILGVFDTEIKDDTAPRNIEGLTFSDDAEKASELSEKLRNDGCQIVVAISHQLYCEDFISRTKGIDILIAGHEHILLNDNYKDAEGKDVKVVETGCYFENIGLLTLEYNKDRNKIESTNEKIINASEFEKRTSDKEIETLLSNLNNVQNEKLTHIVGSTGYDLDGLWESLRINETGMGRLVTSAYINETGADIAFENAGGIRIGKVLTKGKITYKDIVDTAPYGNYIVTKRITGKDVKSIIEKSINIGIENRKSFDEWKKTGSDKVRWSDNNGSYLQFGGIDVVYDISKPYNQRIMSAKVNGVNLEDNNTYVIATNNYISLGKFYTELADVPELNQYSSCEEALINFIELGESEVNASVNRSNLKEIGQNKKSIMLTEGSSNAFVNGEKVDIGSTPEIINGITMVPLRFVAENLGGSVEWSSNDKSATILKGDTLIFINTNTNTVYLNNEKVILDSSVFIDEGRIYVPLIFIAESMGADVDWNSNEKEIILTIN